MEVEKKDMDDKQKDLQEYKKKYHMFRHHAWAGSVLLALLLALKTLDLLDFSDLIVASIGGVLIAYTLTAVFFTYRYSSGLKSENETKIIKDSDDVEKEKIRADLEKEKLKVEKKKAKAAAKSLKKYYKEKAKNEKKDKNE